MHRMEVGGVLKPRQGGRLKDPPQGAIQVLSWRETKAVKPKGFTSSHTKKGQLRGVGLF